MIRVGIADDSPFTCRLLASHLESSGLCTVVGVAHDTDSAFALANDTRPDVLTLDLEMPGNQGLGLLRRLMAECPLPIVIVSGVSRRAAATTLQALDLGAVDFVLKYTPGVRSNPDALRREIIAKVTAAAAVAKAVWADGVDQPTPVAESPAGASHESRRTGAGILVVGASTGGPTAVRELLSQLPADYPNAVLIVQHLPAAFTPVLAGLLTESLGRQVEEVTNSHRLEAGRALIAPGGLHVIVKATGCLELCPPADSDLYRPSIDVAMRSAADAFGTRATGVVLTGMGHDGAEGLRAIRQRGGQVLVQKASTCVIAGMPERALEAAGADFVGSPAEIGRELARQERGRAA